MTPTLPRFDQLAPLSVEAGEGSWPPSPSVQRSGKPIRSFRKSWAKAYAAAKMPGLIFHDLRRSAVRNPVSAGVDQTVAMKFTGHKTVSVFQRYRIVSDEDVRAAVERTEAAVKLAGPRNVIPIRRYWPPLGSISGSSHSSARNCSRWHPIAPDGSEHNSDTATRRSLSTRSRPTRIPRVMRFVKNAPRDTGPPRC